MEFTMTEAWAWGWEADELVNHSDAPGDSPLRRPSHADRRRSGGNHCARRFERFCSRGGPKHKLRRLPTGCSIWSCDVHDVPARTATAPDSPISLDMGLPRVSNARSARTSEDPDNEV